MKPGMTMEELHERLNAIGDEYLAAFKAAHDIFSTKLDVLAKDAEALPPDVVGTLIVACIARLTKAGDEIGS